jgi:hypothetical protein
MAEERDPLPTSPAEAELLEIGQVWPALVAKFDAENLLNTQYGAVSAPLWGNPPEALRVQRDDHGVAHHRPPVFHSLASVARLREYVPVWEEQIAAAGGRVGFYHHQLARAREVIASYEAWQADIAAAEEASGLTASIARTEALLAELHALSQRVRKLPAHTLAGLIIKARISAWEREPIDDDKTDDLGTLVANSLIRDLLAVEG